MTASILGVIEGFYGQPYSQEVRLHIIDRMVGWGWNTYVWAAKLEPRHREQWNEPFTDEELECFSELSHRSSAVQVAVGVQHEEETSSKNTFSKAVAQAARSTQPTSTSSFDSAAISASASLTSSQKAHANTLRS